MVARLILLAVALSLTGCDKRDWRFPSPHEDVCLRELRSAADCLTELGVGVELPNKITVLLQRHGTVKTPDGWAWLVGKDWVLGTTYKNGSTYEVTVGAAPDGSTGVLAERTLKHEFGHVLLLEALDDSGHSPAYASCFRNWKQYASTSRVVVDGDLCRIIDVYSP